MEIRKWMEIFILNNDVQTVDEVVQAYREEFNIENEIFPKEGKLERIARLAFADSILT